MATDHQDDQQCAAAETNLQGTPAPAGAVPSVEAAGATPTPAREEAEVITSALREEPIPGAYEEDLDLGALYARIVLDEETSIWDKPPAEEPYLCLDARVGHDPNTGLWYVAVKDGGCDSGLEVCRTRDEAWASYASTCEFAAGWMLSSAHEERDLAWSESRRPDEEHEWSVDARSDRKTSNAIAALEVAWTAAGRAVPDDFPERILLALDALSEREVDAIASGAADLPDADTLRVLAGLAM